MITLSPSSFVALLAILLGAVFSSSSSAARLTERVSRRHDQGVTAAVEVHPHVPPGESGVRITQLKTAPASGPNAVDDSRRPVEILRDHWGTPYVFADHETDGFFGLGYAGAEDRMLQMDLLRRRGAGRLAEVFGEPSFETDRAARIAGHARHALGAFAKLPGEMQEWLKAYAAGVNAWMQEHSDVIARRFQALGVLPEPWTPVDCLLAARGTLSLGSPFNEGPVNEYHRFQGLAAQVGEAEASKQFQMVIDDDTAIVPETEMAKDTELYQRLKARAKTTGFSLRAAPGEGPKMSHAWAVGGKRSTTGKPILENDPQLPLCTPPFFYEFHLAAGRITARGVGVPGCPGLFVGFNRHVAWGGSALGADSVVIFLDRLTPDGQGYLFKGRPVPFDRRLEVITVKGGPDVVQEVFTSRHGTVFNSLARNPRPGEAYLCYDPQSLEEGTDARAMLALLTARDWTEFRSALTHYYDPGLHIVYADVAGNIGYQTAVYRPLTARSPRLALEGWTGDHELTGRIPLDELPHMLNPDTGFISHANNLPVGSWYPHDLGLATGGNGDTGRSLRLRQLLAGERNFSVDDFEATVHRDDLNPMIATLLPVARKVVEEDRVTDTGVRRLLDGLKGWNLHAGTARQFPGARALENTLTPYRRAGLQNIYGAGGGGVAHLARKVSAAFVKDGSTPKNPAVREYLVNWLRAGTVDGNRRGAASDDWTTRMTQARPAAAGEWTIRIPYQRSIPLNLPVVDAALDLVSPPLTCLDQGTIWSQPGNVYTHIVDLADVDNSRAMIAPGNAEDPESPLRKAGVEIWVKGGTRPAPLSRQKIEPLIASRLAPAVQPYNGAIGPRERVVDQAPAAARFLPAIPAVKAEAQANTKPLPGRKPDDPALEAAFRYLLRNERTPAEIDAKIDEVTRYVAGQPALETQLQEALKLGVYLVEESQAGRLKVSYGSPHCLKRMLDLLGQQNPPRPPSGPQRAPAPRPEAPSPRASSSPAQPEVWLCAGERIADLLSPDAEWSFVKQHLSGIKLYVDQVNDATPEQLREIVRLVQENRYQVAVELGGCLDFAPMDDTAGEWSARHELAKIAKFYAAGGKVDFLDLDGPVRRLMHPEDRRDGQRFESMELAVDELVDAVRLIRQAHPEIRFWLLTNFPNWGYKGDVSYHARGPQRQDYGEYDAAHRLVWEKLKAAGIPLSGVTIDNPYDYLLGEHSSVNLKDPKSVDWLKRVRAYEDRCRAEGLEVNLIVNSERGGHESDELFYRETLRMVDTYRTAGGRPTRWFVQSWYPHPKQIVPETAPHSMSALVKAAIERVRSDKATDTDTPPNAQSQATTESSRIALQPQPGAMQVTARVPGLDNQAFALGIPETIGCREAMLVNFPEARIEWQGPDEAGVVSCSWGPGGRISYSLQMIPADDYVDIAMTIRNRTEFFWHDVFAFNCLNPVEAPAFQDWKLDRTYMSSHGQPLRMAQTRRVKGHMPTVGFYLPERVEVGEESIFVRGFGATSPDRTDGSWIVTLSEPAGTYMASTAVEAAFLFDNLDRCCLHAAPSFGDIGPGEGSSTVSRLYLAKGGLDAFLKRRKEELPGLIARQKWARPDSPATNKVDDTAQGRASATLEARAELAKWDDASTHRPQTGPGGTAWDSH